MRSNDRIEGFKLLGRARSLLEELGGRDLSEIEQCLQKAIELSPNSLEALHEAARFYDSILPNPEKSRRYAAACRERAAQIQAEMEKILGQGSEKGKNIAPPARQIGGIIGPY